VARPVVINVTAFDEAGAARFRDDIDRASQTGQPVIPIVIDSLGGDIYALLSMLDAIEAVRGSHHVATIAHGRAMSCGSVLLTAGDEGKRFVAPSATVMVHDAATTISGKTASAEADANECRRLDDLTYAIMDRRCGHKAGYFRRLVHDHDHGEVYLSPKDAVKHKIANHVGVPSLTVMVDVAWAFTLTDPKSGKVVPL
jgi:ATP-dependent Clp protease protease subunit